MRGGLVDFDFKTLEAIGKKIVEIVPAATALAAPFLGPAGVPVALVGAGVKTLGAALGLTETEATPEKVLETLSSDPEARLKILQAQNDFALKMKDLERLEQAQRMDTALKAFQAVVADGQSARDRQIQHEKVTGKTDINLYMLAWLFIAGFFITLIVMVILIMTGKFPKDVPPAAVYLLGSLNGTLTAGVGAIIQYFFGKTKDSAAHVEALTNSIPLDQLGKISGGK